MLIISPDKGFKTIQELVAAAKAKPGTFNYASVGVGSGTHLSVEKLKLSAGFDAVHVPFRGGPEALTEVIAGRVEFYFCPINTALPLIREGKLIALVTSTTTRRPTCRTCRPWPKRATGTPNSRSGSACWRRSRRRATSSTSSTPKPSRRSADAGHPGEAREERGSTPMT